MKGLKGGVGKKALSTARSGAKHSLGERWNVVGE